MRLDPFARGEIAPLEDHVTDPRPNDAGRGETGASQTSLIDDDSADALRGVHHIIQLNFAYLGVVAKRERPAAGEMTG